MKRRIDGRSLTLTSLTEWTLSGPKRYDYMPSTDDWRYSRDGEGMGILLEQELGRALGREVKLGLECVSEAAE